MKLFTLLLPAAMRQDPRRQDPTAAPRGRGTTHARMGNKHMHYVDVFSKNRLNDQTTTTVVRLVLSGTRGVDFAQCSTHPLCFDGWSVMPKIKD